MEPYNLCIIKPNKEAFSETFIQEHIDRLPGNKKVLYGGSFPVYDQDGNFLIKSKLGLLIYLIQKRVFKRQNIPVRTNALVNYLKLQKIDIVLAEYGTVGAMVTEACKLANIPLVIHFHGADAHHRATISAYFKLYEKAFKYASAIIAVSSDMVMALKRLGVPADKIYLNPYGVDTSKFPQIDISGSDINFLAIGRFVEKKSPLSVIKAFNIVSKRFPDAHLWMVGAGPLYNDTQSLIQRLGLNEHISLTGILSPTEIQKLMRKMRCFVQHSITAPDGDMEGTPNSILEAASSALPVVSTRHAGIKEAVIDEQTGYLVDENDIEGMGEKMAIFAESPSLAAQFGEAGRKHIINNYQLNDRIKSLGNIIQQSLKK